MSISLKTSKARYNFEPFSLNIIAEGDLDSLNFKQVNINQEIFLSGYAAFGKEKDIDLKLSFASLDLQKYLKYFSNYSFNKSLEGKASLELHYKSSLSDSISGF